MAQKLVHKRSNQPLKAPTGATLDYGEIAVNYNVQSPFLSIKNSDNTYSKFSSDDIIAAGMVEYVSGELKGYSVTGHTHDDRYYTETEINTKLAGKSDTGHTHTKAQITDFEHTHGTVTLTYDALVTLRNSSQLISGQQYRITDYVTTTTQENTRSAGHPFDIIVTADSENTLNEEAKAIQNIDDGYFDDSNLSAWKLWYCLDNDTDRFAWAGDVKVGEIEYKHYYSEECTIKSELVNGNVFITPFNFESCVWVDGNGDGDIGYGGDGSNHDESELVYEWGYFTDENGNIQLCLYKSNADLYEEEGQPDYDDKYLYRGVVNVDGTDYDYWQKWDANDESINIDYNGTIEHVYATTARIVSNPETYSVTIETEDIYEYGKGVIYRMIDEFGNDCPYDFKNIQFKRWKITSEDPALESYKSVLESDYVGIKQTSISPNYMPTNLIIPDESQYQWFYTFNSSDGSDRSLFGDICYGNIIKPWFTNNNTFALNNIVIKNANGILYNKFDLNCFCMSIGNFSNTTSTEIFNNVFDKYCRANIFLSDNVYQNIISGNAVNNLFIGSIQLNTINAYFQTNMFNNMIETIIGTQCKNNICHGDVYGNFIENYFQYNTINTKLTWCNIGPQTHHNTLTNVRQCMIEYGCQHNTINSATNSTFKSMFQHNEVSNITACNFGNGFRYNVFKTSSDLLGDNRPYIQGCTFGNYIWYNNFYNTTEASSSNAIKNLNVQSYLQGVETVDSNGLNVMVYNQIEVPVGVDYEVKVAKNSSGVIKVYCEADLIA